MPQIRQNFKILRRKSILKLFKKASKNIFKNMIIKILFSWTAYINSPTYFNYYASIFLSYGDGIFLPSVHNIYDHFTGTKTAAGQMYATYRRHCWGNSFQSFYSAYWWRNGYDRNEYVWARVLTKNHFRVKKNKNCPKNFDL